MIAEQRHKLRKKKANPTRDELRAWLDRNLDGPQLIRYLDDGRVEISNMLCENAIRPFVIGRKNWLFSDTPAGGHASAKLYSIIETAKAAGIEPFAYLRHIFKKLPQATTPADVEALLPWNIAPAALKPTR
jgi:transposase